MKNVDDLLNPHYIRDFLSIESKLLVPVIQVYESIGSTNNVLMEKNCLYPSGHVCFAENQMLGRGQSRRSWVSAKKNICFSVSWNYEQTIKEPHMLNFYVAVKLAKALSKESFLNIKTKWPNDLIFDSSKFLGILIDLVHKKDSKIYLVVGIGINIEVSEEDKKNVKQNITDLKSINSNNAINKNRLASILLAAVVECLSEFENCDYKKLSEEWNNIDCNYDKIKTIMINNEKIKTTIKGINEFGQLCCFHNNKMNHYNINEVEIIKDEFLRN